MTAVSGLTKTHCPYCSLQCGITLDAGTAPVTLAPQDDFPTNLGGLCAKGWTAAELLDHPARLTQPLVRDSRGEPLRPTDWDDALDRIVAGFNRSRDAYGPDSVGCFGGGGLTNEKAYQFGKFARVALGTSSIDYNGRFCMSSAANAATRVFGIDRGLPFPVADLAEADAVLLVGWNPADTMPPVMQFLDAGRSRGARHIVIDPRATTTARGAQLHLQPVPGTDLALANGMLHVAIREKLIDEDYIAKRTTGFEAVRRAVRLYWPDRVERITGVPEKDLARFGAHPGRRRACDHPHSARRRATPLRLGHGDRVHQPGTGTWASRTPVLRLRHRDRAGQWAGRPRTRAEGRPAARLPPPRRPGRARPHRPSVGHRSSRPAAAGPVRLRDARPTRHRRRGSRAVGDGVEHRRFGTAFGACHRPDRGTGFPGGVGLLPLGDRRVGRCGVAERAVGRGDRHHDQPRRPGHPPRGRPRTPGGGSHRPAGDGRAWPSEWAGQGFPTFPRRCSTELRRASAGGKADYSGISYPRIKAEQGVFWPCPSPLHPGTPRLFTEDFPTRDRRAHFHPVEQIGAAELPDAHYPYYLTTGRLLHQYQSGTQTRRVASLAEAEPEAVVEMHDTLAQRIDVKAGELVRLRTRRGSAVMAARIVSGIRSGHGVRAVPLGRRRQRQHAHQPDRWTPIRRCPSSRSARSPLIAPTSPTLTPTPTPTPTPKVEEPMPDSSTPRFLQGPFQFEGKGLDSPFLLRQLR